MDSGMGGLGIMPLPQTTEFDVTDIFNYITRVLQQFDIQDVYSIFAGICQSEGLIVPTFIFRLRQSNIKEILLHETPNNWPIWVQEDCILSVNELETAWALGPVSGVQELTL
ncbi:hypothetical protein L873DRAFT_1869406 [Choiromyces venosus 120613-1]|uniref:Uncharacterized protein n=1 Tax=Choiromyces venosus 120613-1 TaxID=1336337 RepID=A0A3N4IZ81_9PEZI|nr:hypothetical protein L873DRAFT_1869406 [Choiromyces venosus 120613-1]